MLSRNELCVCNFDVFDAIPPLRETLSCAHRKFALRHAQGITVQAGLTKENSEHGVRDIPDRDGWPSARRLERGVRRERCGAPTG
jgi:hypothetical protein